MKKKKKIELKRIDVEKLLTILDKLIKNKKNKRGRTNILCNSNKTNIQTIMERFRIPSAFYSKKGKNSRLYNIIL